MELTWGLTNKLKLIKSRVHKYRLLTQGSRPTQKANDAITTRSGLAYDGPLPPMPPPYVNPDNEMAKETKVTKDKVQPESSQSTANVQPRVDHGKGKDKLKDDEFSDFSNPLFEKQDGFPSRNDESILKEEVSRISPKVNSEPSIESLPKDDFDNDDDLFEMDSNNDEWKRILYGEDFERMGF
ncbi:hypothetical protein Tco_1134525 [Tanacetum coccineum]